MHRGESFRERSGHAQFEPELLVIIVQSSVVRIEQ